MDAVYTDHDRRFSRLSLIDFASEDDLLISSPSCDFHDANSLGFAKEDEEQDNFERLETVESNRIEERTDGFEQREDEPQLLPSSEPERIERNGKYNLRKSLAWDSAFLTGAGFLDPEELTSMIAPVGRHEKRVLPIIPEDVLKSSDSISTLGSEIMPLESIEGNLFEDIKDGSASSKQSDGLQGPGRTTKQNSSQPREAQQLKAMGKLPSNSTLTKRPSLAATVNDSTTSGAGSADGQDSVGLRSTTHKLSRLPTAGTREQKTSSEVSISSSNKVGKSSSKDARIKTDCKASPSSRSTQKTQSRVAPKVKTRIGNSRLPSYTISQSKHSSGISSASSKSEWSTESSSNSTHELQSNSSRASLHSISSKRISVDSDASHDGSNPAVGSHTQTTGSIKPSGLRLPSPKIGYFDGGKTSIMKSNVSVPGGTTKIGAGNVSAIGGQNKTKPSKLQPVTVLPKSTTRAVSQPNLNLKSHKTTATKMSKTNELDQEVKELGCDGSNTDMHNSDVCAISIATREMSLENEAGSNANETTSANTDGELNGLQNFGT
ncbi:hypothetical protein SDJN02_09175 [Cucurbita argyrosperma subsp. argyrosperma]|nr:hypothetical protein SDJN02_09175 [Cucurbita argyrosperma subsp. argyrosperma]